MIGLLGCQEDAELVDRSAGFTQPAGQKDDADAARNRHDHSFGSDRACFGPFDLRRAFHVELTWIPSVQSSIRTKGADLRRIRDRRCRISIQPAGGLLRDGLDMLFL